MKLASMKNGRDGALVVVSRDVKTAVDASAVAPTMQAALDDWETLEPALQALFAALNNGTAENAFALDFNALAAPLPRAYQYLDGACYISHISRNRAARGDSGGGAGACGEIASFYVLPAEWRQGTGRRLGETAVAEAHARGFAEVAIWVLETNARARGFYEALGFRPDGESKVFLERPYATWRELRYRRAV